MPLDSCAYRKVYGSFSEISGAQHFVPLLGAGPLRHNVTDNTRGSVCRYGRASIPQSDTTKSTRKPFEFFLFWCSVSFFARDFTELGLLISYLEESTVEVTCVGLTLSIPALWAPGSDTH